MELIQGCWSPAKPNNSRSCACRHCTPAWVSKDRVSNASLLLRKRGTPYISLHSASKSCANALKIAVRSTPTNPYIKAQTRRAEIEVGGEKRPHKSVHPRKAAIPKSRADISVAEYLKDLNGGCLAPKKHPDKSIHPARSRPAANAAGSAAKTCTFMYIVKNGTVPIERRGKIWSGSRATAYYQEQCWVRYPISALVVVTLAV